MIELYLGADPDRPATSRRSTTTSSAPEIAYIVNDSDAKVLVGHERFADAVAKARHRARRCPTTRCFAVGTRRGLPALRRAHRRPADHRAGGPHRRRRPCTTRRARPAAPRACAAPLVDIDPDDMASSDAASRACSACKPRDGNVHISGSPLYHTAVLMWTANALHMGHTVVVMDKWTPEGMLRAHRRAPGDRPATWCRPSSTACSALPEDVRKRYDVSSLRSMVHAAAPCPPDVKRQMIDWWGDSIMEYYAATEGGGTIITAGGVADEARHGRPGLARLGDPHPRRGGQRRARRHRGHRLHEPRPGRLRVQGRRGEDQGEPPAPGSSPSATGASSTTTATCS